jgi:hypothetical protein
MASRAFEEDLQLALDKYWLRQTLKFQDWHNKFFHQKVDPCESIQMGKLALKLKKKILEVLGTYSMKILTVIKNN